MGIFSLSSKTFKNSGKRNTLKYSASQVEGADPFSANVVFYMNGDLLGDKTGRHTVSSSGSAGLSSAKGSPISDGRTTNNSIITGQNTSSFLTISNNLNDFNWTSTDWTVEFWLMDPEVSTGNYFHILVADGQGGRGTFKGYSASGDAKNYGIYFYSSSGGGPGASYNAYLLGNTWHHIAIERSTSGTSRLYINGKLRETASYSLPGGTPTSVTMGAWSGESATTYIDEIRVTRAIKYNGVNFTPRQSVYL